jgi:hypothetical protein
LANVSSIDAIFLHCFVECTWGLLSHFHYCDIGGHEWVCEETTCSCMCGVLMSDGDHSECPIELLACPEHNGNDLQPESSMFAAAVQSVLDDAEVTDDCDGGIEPGSK